MVVRGRRSSELAALHDTKRTLNNRGGGGGGRSSVSSISDVSSIAGSVASKAKAAAQEMADIIQNEFALLEEAGAKEKFFSDSDKNSCILVIGSTGTGKSSTISKCTGRSVPAGNGRDRVTVRCDKYTVKEGRKDDPVWVDTVGWDDADLEDENTFKNILRYLKEKNLLRVKTILWTILPNVRKDALLSKQANMINKFKEVDIWSNVIIVCKQSRNPEDDTQGALYAAKAFSPDLEVPVLGYTFLEDPSWTSRQRSRFEDKDARDDFMVRNDQEVRDVIFGTISTLGKPIQVVFKNHRCLDCGETGDSRLMPTHCHMEAIYVHPGNIVQYHPGRIERHHDSSTVIREHSGALYRPWYSCDIICCNMGGERYTCCGALNGQPGCAVIRSCCRKPYREGDDLDSGCKERYACCKVLVGSKVSGCKNRYDCCDRKSKSKGCREVCKKCDKPWGTKANGCFEKEHNIIIDAGESNRMASAAASAANIARGIGNRIDVL